MTEWKSPTFSEDWEKFDSAEIARLVNLKVRRLQDVHPKTYDEAMDLASELAGVVIGMNIILDRLGKQR